MHDAPHVLPSARTERHPWEAGWWRAAARQLATSAINTAWERACLYGAIGPDHPRAARFGAFGAGSMLAFPPGAVYNERWIRVGASTIIGPRVSLSAGIAPGQQMVTDPVVSIGDRVLIGRGSHIVGHFRIEIGDDVQTGPYVYITDQNHGYTDPDQPIGIQMPTEKPVVVGAGSWLGAGVVVLPGALIGRNVAVGAGSVVTGPLPDHCVAVGAPARVIRRYTAAEGWRAVGPSTGGAGSFKGCEPPTDRGTMAP